MQRLTAKEITLRKKKKQVGRRGVRLTPAPDSELTEMVVEQIKKVKFMEGVSAQAKMKALSTE